MFRHEVKLKCTVCGCVFKKSIGIKTCYKINVKNNNAKYYEEWCPDCNKEFLEYNKKMNYGK